jgi:hypothetical protein
MKYLGARGTLIHGKDLKSKSPVRLPLRKNSFNQNFNNYQVLCFAVVCYKCLVGQWFFEFWLSNIRLHILLYGIGRKEGAEAQRSGKAPCGSAVWKRSMEALCGRAVAKHRQGQEHLDKRAPDKALRQSAVGRRCIEALWPSAGRVKSA